ncbi:hypothetical protein [Deinococcus ruber]|uniref:Secreted protein n=1 Tax=Deinococcus ruber TaxID=1848197 RepID=A0A918FI59_9DEIO|nr:hypothetical protein [Deinococcus ruber]GGR39171.1 hypothetical protein GCM10008957_55120 [Deinococcus ruber]
MKKLSIAALILAGAAFGSTAGAQTWDLDQGHLKLVECYGGQDGVYCDFTFTLTKSQVSTVTFTNGGMNNIDALKVYVTDGTAHFSDAVSIMNQSFNSEKTWASSGSERADIIYGIPIKVRWYFNIPSALTSFRALEFNGQRIENVVIRPPKSAKPPVATTMPSAPSVTGFSIALSNCRLNKTVYTCTATLTPTK